MQKDWLGQPLNVGDYVVVAVNSVGRSQMRAGYIVGDAEGQTIPVRIERDRYVWFKKPYIRRVNLDAVTLLRPHRPS